jgi:hypothetical protein
VFPTFNATTTKRKTVNIGDLVQWACNGIDQFDTPRRVRAMQMQDQQERAFVEGSNTGMPVSELTVVTSASAVMEKALSDPVASPLISETCERSAASLSAQHAAGTADGSLPTGAGPERQTRHFTAGICVAPEKHTSRTSTWVLAFALAAIASEAGIYAIIRINRSLESPLPIMTATPPLLPSPMPPPPPAPVITDAAPPVAPDAPAPAMERSGLAELDAAEIWELQARLEFLGMRPGSLDGVPGPETAAAIRRYEQSRRQANTGKLDRKLLERLRQEPN